MYPNKYNESLPKGPSGSMYWMYIVKLLALGVIGFAIVISMVISIWNQFPLVEYSQNGLENTSSRWVLTTSSNGSTVRQEGSMTEDACKAVMNEFISLKMADIALCLDPETGSTHSQKSIL